MKSIALDNNWVYKYQATRDNAATGISEPASGLTGIYGHLSATDEGSTINAALRVLLSEYGTTGIYHGTVLGSDLRLYLAAGTTVYEVFGDGINVFTSVPRRVQAVRRP